MTRSFRNGMAAMALAIGLGGGLCLSRAQSSPEPTERHITIGLSGKKERCQVLQSWTLPGGARAYQVRVVQTGELVTVVREAEDEESNKEVLVRVYRWVNGVPPNGTPVAPVGSDVYRQPARQEARQTSANSVQPPSPTSPPVQWSATPKSQPRIDTSIDVHRQAPWTRSSQTVLPPGKQSLAGGFEECDPFERPGMPGSETITAMPQSAMPQSAMPQLIAPPLPTPRTRPSLPNARDGLPPVATSAPASHVESMPPQTSLPAAHVAAAESWQPATIQPVSPTTRDRTVSQPIPHPPVPATTQTYVVVESADFEDDDRKLSLLEQLRGGFASQHIPSRKAVPASTALVQAHPVAMPSMPGGWSPNGTTANLPPRTTMAPGDTLVEAMPSRPLANKRPAPVMWSRGMTTTSKLPPSMPTAAGETLVEAQPSTPLAYKRPVPAGWNRTVAAVVPGLVQAPSVAQAPVAIPPIQTGETVIAVRDEHGNLMPLARKRPVPAAGFDRTLTSIRANPAAVAGDSGVPSSMPIGPESAALIPRTNVPNINPAIVSTNSQPVRPETDVESAPGEIVVEERVIQEMPVPRRIPTAPTPIPPSPPIELAPSLLPIAARTPQPAPAAPVAPAPSSWTVERPQAAPTPPIGGRAPARMPVESVPSAPPAFAETGPKTPYPTMSRPVAVPVPPPVIVNGADSNADAGERASLPVAPVSIDRPLTAIAPPPAAPDIVAPSVAPSAAPVVAAPVVVAPTPLPPAPLATSPVVINGCGDQACSPAGVDAAVVESPAIADGGTLRDRLRNLLNANRLAKPKPAPAQPSETVVIISDTTKPASEMTPVDLAGPNSNVGATPNVVATQPTPVAQPAMDAGVAEGFARVEIFDVQLPPPMTHERTVTVGIEGKKLTCRLLQSWTPDDGGEAYLVKALETGKRITVVRDKNVSATQTEAPARIYPWADDATSPEGAPVPPPLPKRATMPAIDIATISLPPEMSTTALVATVNATSVDPALVAPAIAPPTIPSPPWVASLPAAPTTTANPPGEASTLRTPDFAGAPARTSNSNETLIPSTVLDAPKVPTPAAPSLNDRPISSVRPAEQPKPLPAVPASPIDGRGDESGFVRRIPSVVAGRSGEQVTIAVPANAAMDRPAMIITASMHDQRVVAQLIEVVKASPHPTQREEAVLELGKYDGRAHLQLVTFLNQAALTDAAPTVRMAAIHALARMNPPSPIVATTLETLQNDGDVRVRHAAVEAAAYFRTRTR